MHIHGGTGNCPPASAAVVYKGNRFIGASVGDKYYGPVVTSLTILVTRVQRAICPLAVPRSEISGTNERLLSARGRSGYPQWARRDRCALHHAMMAERPTTVTLVREWRAHCAGSVRSAVPSSDRSYTTNRRRQRNHVRGVAEALRANPRSTVTCVTVLVPRRRQAVASSSPAADSQARAPT